MRIGRTEPEVSSGASGRRRTKGCIDAREDFLELVDLEGGRVLQVVPVGARSFLFELVDPNR
jgi:hypothetical protein